MATTNDTLRVSDMEYLFEALNHTASPIVINVAILAASKGALVKTTGGRVKAIAKRYGLEITTTTKGDSMSAGMTNGAAAASPAKATATATAAATRKRKAPPVRKMKTNTKKGKGSEEDESESGVSGKGNESDEEGPAAKKGKKSNGKAEQEDAGVDDEEDASVANGEDAGEELA